MLQNGSASHILAYGSAYIKSGKVNYINSKEAVFDCVDYSTLDCMYKKKGLIPDIDSLFSRFEKIITPVMCSGKFNEINSLVSYPHMSNLSCVILNTRGYVDNVDTSETVYSRVSPLSFTGVISYCQTF